jgi:hypothetical protein
VNADSLRTGLNWILRITESARTLPADGIVGYWDGDIAGERQVRDNWAAGRAHWHTAHANAKHGLEALERGDLEQANMWLQQAKTFCIEALLKRVQPEDLAALARPSKKRGRRPKKK